MTDRNYVNGFIAGGVLGVLLGSVITSRKAAKNKSWFHPDEISNYSSRIMRGVMEMMRS